MAKNDISAKVNGLLQPYLAEHGLDIYRTEYKKEGPGRVLRVYLDKPAGAESEYVSIEECEKVNSWLSDALDADDFIVVIILREKRIHALSQIRSYVIYRYYE